MRVSEATSSAGDEPFEHTLPFREREAALRLGDALHEDEGEGGWPVIGAGPSPGHSLHRKTSVGSASVIQGT